MKQQDLMLNTLEKFLRAKHIGENLPDAEPKKALPFITISREAGSGGITIGKLLAKKLCSLENEKESHWTVFDKNLVDYVLEDHGLSKDIADYMPEDKISEIQDTIEELFGLHPSNWSLVHKTSETILRLARMGHSIIVGRGGNIITQKLRGGFHIRLVAPKEIRLKHLSEYYGISDNEASDFLKREDTGRRQYLKDHFGQNVDDATLYDIVINTGKISYENAAATIIDLMSSK